MRRIWIDRLLNTILAALALLILLAGCATNKDELLPHGDQTMLDVWQQETGGAGSGASIASRQLLDARQSLRRPLTGCQGSGIRDQESAQFPAAKPPQELLIPDPCHPIPVYYTRTAAHEVYSQFHRLPNPDLAMYVFPHLAGSDPVPVPGYTTVFPLYQRVQYALPGERTEDY